MYNFAEVRDQEDFVATLLLVTQFPKEYLRRFLMKAKDFDDKHFNEVYSIVEEKFPESLAVLKSIRCMK